MKLELNNQEMLIFFTFLSLILLFLTLAVASARNPVHSVCYLILIYLLSSIILFLIGQEFLAIIYIIVYIGAIMVLFLFIIMMLNIRLIEMRSTSFSYLPIGIVSVLLFSILIYIIIVKMGATYNLFFFDLINVDLLKSYNEWILFVEYKLTNIHYIGLFLYNKYLVLLIISGFLLFIATIGSILISYISLKDTVKIK